MRIKKETKRNKEIFNEIVDGVIIAKSGCDLKKLLDKVYDTNFNDPSRSTFLLGLLQGALFQFKKDVSIEELETLFKKINSK